MNRTEKQTLIDGLHEEFGKSPHAILVDFRGLSVPAVTEFRRKVRQSGSRYRVVKNRLALRAVKDTPLEKLAEKFENTTGVAYNSDRSRGPGQGPHRLRQGPPAAQGQGGWSRGRRCSTRKGSRPSPPCPACPSCAAGCWAC